MAFVRKPGGWWRAGASEDNPFDLGQGLDDLEDRIEAGLEGQAVIDETELGSTGAGTDGTFPVSGNHCTVVSGTLPDGDWQITAIRVWFVTGPAGAGVQNIRPVAFEDSGGSPVTGARIVAGSTIAIASPGVTPERFEFPVTGAPDVSGTFWFGVHADSLTNNQALAFPYTSGGRFLQNSDTYSDGTGTPFGAITFDDTKTFGISCVLESVIAEGITNIVGTGAATVTIDEDGVATVDVPDLDPDSATASTGYDTRSVLDASAVFYGEPEAAAQVSALSVADVSGTLYFEISEDGTTGWTKVSEDASALVDGNETASRLVPVGSGYVRRVYENDAVEQTSFALHRGVIS